MELQKALKKFDFEFNEESGSYLSKGKEREIEIVETEKGFVLNFPNSESPPIRVEQGLLKFITNTQMIKDQMDRTDDK